MACLFLDMSALVFLVMILGFFARKANARWDVSYAVKRRFVSAIEQHVYDFLEMALMADLFIALLDWPQLLALRPQHRAAALHACLERSAVAVRSDGGCARRSNLARAPAVSGGVLARPARRTRTARPAASYCLREPGAKAWSAQLLRSGTRTRWAGCGLYEQARPPERLDVGAAAPAAESIGYFHIAGAKCPVQ